MLYMKKDKILDNRLIISVHLEISDDKTNKVIKSKDRKSGGGKSADLFLLIINYGK